MSAVAADLYLFVQMLGSLIAAFGRVILHPTSFRFTSTVHQLERVGWRAVPIILLITVLIGAILAQQGIFHFRKFGADIYVIDMRNPDRNHLGLVYEGGAFQLYRVLPTVSVVDR